MAGPDDRNHLPVVYSCSGASSAAQLANHVAVELDLGGLANMSCIAGVGGDVKSLVRVAQFGRPIVAIDGCPLHCVKACLERHDVQPTAHFTLTELGISKQLHKAFEWTEAQRILSLLSPSVRRLAAHAEPAEPARE